MRNVLTIATGKRIYLNLAINLFKSFKLHHVGDSIEFFLVTDLFEVYSLIDDPLLNVIFIDSNSVGTAFSSKLYLDKLIPDGSTLFIDSDCLIYGNLNIVFTQFEGRAVSVVGSFISHGEWFGDFGKILKQFKLNKSPKFNGGLYYIEKSEIAINVYEKAREIERKYDEIGFKRLRNKPNDEVIMSIAMALYDLNPLHDDGSILGDLFSCQGAYYTNVVRSKARLSNPQIGMLGHQSWYPFESINPIIVHFLSDHPNDWQYKIDVYRLENYFRHFPNFVFEIIGFFKFRFPQQFLMNFKILLRPLYVYILGNRKIKKSEREWD